MYGTPEFVVLYRADHPPTYPGRDPPVWRIKAMYTSRTWAEAARTALKEDGFPTRIERIGPNGDYDSLTDLERDMEAWGKPHSSRGIRSTRGVGFIAHPAALGAIFAVVGIVLVLLFFPSALFASVGTLLVVIGLYAAGAGLRVWSVALFGFIIALIGFLILVLLPGIG